MGAPFGGGQGPQQSAVPPPVWNPLTNSTFTADPGVEEGGYIEVLNYTNAILVASGVEFQSLDIPPLSRWVRQAGPVGIPTMSFITGPTMPGLLTFLDRMQFNVYQPSDAKPTLVSGPLLSLPGVQIPTSSIQPGALPEGVTIGADDVGSVGPSEVIGSFVSIPAARVGVAAPDQMNLFDLVNIVLAVATQAAELITIPNVPPTNPQDLIRAIVSGDTGPSRVSLGIRETGLGGFGFVQFSDGTTQANRSRWYGSTDGIQSDAKVAGPFPWKLQGGNQESGVCGVGANIANAADKLYVAVNFKSHLANIATGITLTAVTQTNVTSVVADNITRDGFRLVITPTAAGDTLWFGTYQTVGN